MSRRARLDAHRLRYNEAVRLGEDFLLYAEALAQGARFLLVEGCGYVAVERAGSLSARHGAQDLEALLTASRALGRRADLFPAMRRRLQRHARTIEVKLRHRRLLDRKADAGMLRALASLARAPTMIVPIGCAVLVDKVARPAEVNARVRLLLEPQEFASDCG